MRTNNKLAGLQHPVKQFRKAVRQLQRLRERSEQDRSVRRRIKLLSARVKQLLRVLNRFGSQSRQVQLLKRASSLGLTMLAGLTLSPAAQSTTLSVTNVAPTVNSVQVDSQANISLTFSKKMNTAELQTAADPVNANLIVYGSLSGNLSTNAATSYFNNDTRVEIDDLQRDFLPGEEITVIAKDLVADDHETLTRGGVYSFRAKAASAPAAFLKSFPGEAGVKQFELGDFDGDGDVDYAGIDDNNLYFWLNDGLGSQDDTEYITADIVELVAGDFNGDGHLDVIGTRQVGVNQQATVFLNNGDMSFAQSSFTIPEVSPQNPSVGDVDNDGDLDIVFPQGTAGINSVMMLNNGDATFASRPIIDPPRGSGSALGDIDGDGDIDLILTAQSGSTVATKIYTNNGDATFSSSTFGENGYRTVRLGDIDGDGDLDAFLSGRFSTSAVWYNNGDGTFSSNAISPIVNSLSAEMGDLDGDGRLDIVMLGGPVSGEPETPIHVFNNFIHGGFNRGEFDPMTFSCAGRFDLGIADMDGDGDLDIVTSEVVGACCSFRNAIHLNASLALKLDPISDECRFVSDSRIFLNLTGNNLPSATRAVLTLPNDQEVSLSTTTDSPFDMRVEIPAGSGTLPGLYTIDLFADCGAASATFTLKPNLTISGPQCACPEVEYNYSATPQLASGESNSWSVEGGVIVSGQGTDAIVVEWDQSTIATITLDRTSSLGVTSSIVKNLDAKTLIVQPDIRLLGKGGTIDVDVLANDIGNKLEIEDFGGPQNGSVEIVDETFRYTPDAGFNGVDVIRYGVVDEDGCNAGSQLALVVGQAKVPGSLHYVERQKNGANGNAGLRRVNDVLVSPDGRHAYAAGRNDHSIVLFQRNSEDGTLSFDRRWRHGKGGVSGIKYISKLAFSPDGAHLYASGFGNNAIAAFERDAHSGELTFVERQNMTGRARPKGLEVSPDGKHLYVAASRTNAVEVYARDAHSGELEFVERLRDGRDGVDGLRGAADVALSPDGKHVYAAGPGDDAVAVFSRDEASGELTFVERLRDNNGGVNGLNDAVAVAVSSDGCYVYVAGNQDDAVAAFARNDSSGALTFIQDYADQDAGIDGLSGIADVALAPDGLQVYAAGETDNALANFSRKVKNGDLNFEERIKDGQVGGVNGLEGPKGVNASPDSRFVYVAGAGENSVAVFRRNLHPIAQDDVMSVEIKVPSNPNKSPKIKATVFNILNNDVDLDGAPIKISNITQPDLGDLTYNIDSTAVSFAQDVVDLSDYEGDGIGNFLNFEYTIRDDEGKTSTATVRITVGLDLPKLGQIQTQTQLDTLKARGILQQLNIAPNPSAGSSRLSFKLFSDAYVEAVVHDVTGRRVANLLDEEFTRGEFLVDWNGASQTGGSLQNGTYYIIVSATNDYGQEQRVIPFVLMK